MNRAPICGTQPEKMSRRHSRAQKVHHKAKRQRDTQQATEEIEMGLDRRRFLTASAAALAAPYVRTSHAAGSLAVGFWDHWVPGANDTLTKLANEWAAKEKVDLKIDYITSQGNKLLLTVTSEAQTKSGHDILSLPIWYGPGQMASLEPVDDVVQPLIAQYGALPAAVEYLGKQDGHWIAVPATAGSQMKGPCARIDLFKQHVG